MILFNKITEENKDLILQLQGNKDMVYYCEFKKWYNINAFRGFGIKYAIDNCIHYKIGKQELVVKSGEFMQTCNIPFVVAYFESQTICKDLCIDISAETVNEVFTILSDKNDFNFDNYLANYFKSPNFFEFVYPAQDASELKKKIQTIVLSINNGFVDETIINKELFYDLAEKMIYNEYGNYLALNGIHSVKQSTKKETLRRLKLAKQYIDDYFMIINDITEVAAIANLSAFHFYRTFKQAFSITPYHYLLFKKLEYSKGLIQSKQHLVSEIAMRCGFSDLPTFSKAFKRYYGIAPAYSYSS